MRGIKIYNDDEVDSDDEMAVMRNQIKQEMINKLASEWNSINQQMERRQYIEMSDDYYDSFTDVNEDSVNDAACAAYEQAIKSGKTEEEARAIKSETADKIWAELDRERQIEENKPFLRMEVIEELLSGLGARMMRPYEHWNEDEKYMEYMENRYSDEY